MTEPKSLIVVMLKNGAQITTACVGTPEQMEVAYTHAIATGKSYRIETGDNEGNIIYIAAKQIALCSIRKFIDEKKAAAKSGIITMDRSIQ